MKKKNICKLNNQGSALIVSIIVIIFVSVLATVILYIAGINYRMKKNEYKTKVVFYSGEMYLERIQSNIIIPISESMDHAYRMTNTNYVSLGNANDRRADFYNNVNDELMDLLIHCYGETDSITNGTGTAPSDSTFVKNIIHNLTSTGPDTGDGIPLSQIYCNDNTLVSFAHCDTATQFIDKILAADAHAFDGNSNPEVPKYYIVLYGDFNQADPDRQEKNYKQFVKLDITNPATGALADADKCRLLIQNVCVVCVQNDHRSIISTDIAIQFPPLDWDNGVSVVDAGNPVQWNAFQMIYYINWKNN